MALAQDQEMVAWANENEAMLETEYTRFIAQTHVELSFDKFCQHAYWQMPCTAAR